MTDIRHVTIDSEDLSGQSYPYQHDIGAVEDIDLLAATPGPDLNWLEDVHLLAEDGVAAVFDRYSNSFLKIHSSRSRRGERNGDRPQRCSSPTCKPATRTASS